MNKIKQWWERRDIGTKGLLSFLLAILLVLTLFISMAIISDGGLCWGDFGCRDWRIQKCLATDRYTREECILIVVGKKP